MVTRDPSPQSSVPAFNVMKDIPRATVTLFTGKRRWPASFLSGTRSIKSRYLSAAPYSRYQEQPEPAFSEG